MKIRIVTLLVLCFIGVCGNTFANHHKEKSLPPGLEKNLERGKPLPPGWQEKLVVGDTLGREVFDRGRVIRQRDGYVTIGVEGKAIRLIENTLEIVEILDDLSD